MTVKLVLTLFLAGCISRTAPDSHHSLTVMTYNVENLFDHQDDPGKDDETYLPLKDKKTPEHRKKCSKQRTSYYRQSCLQLDWSPEVIDRKLQRLASTILEVNKGKGPDFLILQEVENIKILEKLRQSYLKPAGYKKAILLEGPDKRGIDVAILSRLKPAEAPQLHEVLAPQAKGHKMRTNKKPLRGILQARFKLLGGHALSIFAVHFPSQGSPSSYRIAALKVLTEVAKKRPSDEFLIAAGDFNITRKEDQEKQLLGRELQKTWLVSHKSACQSCVGTHNYRGHWSFLDVMLFSKNFLKGPWIWDQKSMRVFKSGRFQKDRSGRPLRFDMGRKKGGVSDHFPLVTEINYRPAKQRAR